MSVSSKLKHFFGDQKGFESNIRAVSRQYHRPELLTRADMLWSRLVYGFNASEYFVFEIYRFNRRERKRYISSGQVERIQSSFNSTIPEEKKEIGIKSEFNRRFAAYVHRDWIYVEECTDEEIHAFLEKHAELMAKPTNRTKGAGIHKIDSGKALRDFDNWIKEIRAEKCLLEEVIRQHPEMSEINPSSVNTIRASTVRDRDGQVHLFAASLRGGSAGSIVDNLHVGGTQYPIDIETGIICRGGVRYDGEKNVLFHPSTHKKMIGFEIPHWDQVVATVLEAGKIPDKVRYIGWDVAITEDGCELVEANSIQGCNGMQLDGIGKRDIVMRWL